MTIRNRPDYGVYLLNLGAQPLGGFFDLPSIGTRVAMAGAWNGASIESLPGGYQTLQGGSPAAALVSLQVGKTPGDPIPMTTGCAVRCDNKFDFLRFSWESQADTYAIIVVSDDAQGNGLELTAEPTVALGVVSIEEGGKTASVSTNNALYVSSVQGGYGQLGTDNTTQGSVIGVRLIGSQVGAATATAVTNPALNLIPQSQAFGSPQVQPGSIGGSSAQLLSAAAGASTIVAAASNVNGIVVRTATLSSGGGGIALCAGTSAPSSAVSNPVFLAIEQEVSPSVSLPREIFLPAGQGLYVYNALANDGSYFVTYDIL